METFEVKVHNRERQERRKISFSFKPHYKTQPKELKLNRLVQEIREKPQRNTHFSWKVNQISNCVFFFFLILLWN